MNVVIEGEGPDVLLVHGFGRLGTRRPVRKAPIRSLDTESVTETGDQCENSSRKTLPVVMMAACLAFPTSAAGITKQETYEIGIKV